MPIQIPDATNERSTKPQFIYHGSCKGINGALMPRPQDGDINRPFPEGTKNVVFATDDKNFAALYSLKTPHMLTAGEAGNIRYSVLLDYKSWKNELASAACNVYAMPSDTFTNTLSKKDGKPTKEWQSTVPVNPAEIIHYTPEKVMQTGTQLFFLDPAVEKKMWNYDEKQGADYSLLNRLEAKRKSGILPETFSILHLTRELVDAGLMRHLNADVGIQPADLPKSPYANLIKDDIAWLKQQTEEKKHAAWEALKPGDTVAFVAPSYASQKEYYPAVENTMKQWGLNVTKPADMITEPGYFNWPNTPERRADHIISALKDQNVKAIFALEGGEGASEVVEYLKKREGELDALPKRAIPFMGYSDNTQLLHYLGQKGLVSAVSGPSTEFLAERPSMDDKQKATIRQNQKSLHNFLMGNQDRQPDVPLIPLNTAAEQTTHVEGRVIGGSDIGISLADRASHHLQADKDSRNILYLEGRSSDALGYALKLLQQHNQLENADAIVLGRYYDNQTSTGDIKDCSVDKIRQVLDEIGIKKPVWFGVPSGHPEWTQPAAPIVPIPLQVQAEISTTAERTTLRLDRFRDMHEAEMARHNTPPVTMETPQPQRSSNGTAPIVMVSVSSNVLHLPNIDAAMQADLQGKRLVLKFDQASTTMTHIALMQLLAAGKLSGVQSIDITSPQPIAPETKGWLKDFQQRHLPNTPMQALTIENENMLTRVAENPDAKKNTSDHSPEARAIDAIKNNLVRPPNVTGETGLPERGGIVPPPAANGQAIIAEKGR